MLPQRDPHTDSYRPGARLLNYRSEPHGTRIELQAHMGFYGDESMAYGVLYVWRPGHDRSSILSRRSGQVPDGRRLGNRALASPPRRQIGRAHV